MRPDVPPETHIRFNFFFINSVPRTADSPCSLRPQLENTFQGHFMPVDIPHLRGVLCCQVPSGQDFVELFMIYALVISRLFENY